MFDSNPLVLTYGDATRRHLELGGWGRFFTTDWEHVKAPVTGVEDARGWPALALWCQLDHESNWSAQGGIMLTPDRPRREPESVRVLPWRPIWAGFAFNTTFYASLVLAMFLTSRFVTSRRRLGAHQCPRCGYAKHDLRVCPECGRTAT
jgi:hypothetical protein